MLRVASPLGFMLALGLSVTNAHAFNVFGKDDRVPQRSTELPWAAIGRVETATGNCTGTLIGKDLVLTAAHCLIDRKAQRIREPAEVMFKANLIDGQYKHWSRGVQFWLGTSSLESTPRSLDWAVIRLQAPLGEMYGYLGYTSLTLGKSWNPNTYLFTNVGYSGDFLSGRTAGVHTGCRIMNKSSSGAFLNDCDLNRGASGGPILWESSPGDWRVIAVNSAQYVAPDAGENGAYIGDDYEDSKANLAADLTSAIELIGRLREEQPKKKE